eukprot:2386117-Pyramimonas_sp.AAC.1
MARVAMPHIALDFWASCATCIESKRSNSRRPASFTPSFRSFWAARRRPPRRTRGFDATPSGPAAPAWTRAPPTPFSCL